jgi:hypothetical protein
MARDRFFAYPDLALCDQVIIAALHGVRRQAGFAVFHKGAMDSFMQTQPGEANVQLKLYASDVKLIDGSTCITVEADIDYYKDLLAHGLLEIVINSMSAALTNPRQVYVLRWIAGGHGGVPEFYLPCTIVLETNIFNIVIEGCCSMDTNQLPL